MRVLWGCGRLARWSVVRVRYAYTPGYSYGGFQPPEYAPFGRDGFIRRLHLRSLTIHELEKLGYAYAQPVRRIFDRKQLIVDESN